jgi:hypothetical protein
MATQPKHPARTVTAQTPPSLTDAGGSRQEQLLVGWLFELLS